MVKTQQLDLFSPARAPRKPKTPADIEATMWAKGLVETAGTMPREFWFSELRVRYGREPKAPSWWGMATHALKRAGLLPSDRVRNAPAGYGDRKGGQDRLWVRGNK